MEFSIIIPQYGRSDLTRRCVESILAHEMGSLQIIVVDDGSARSDVESIRTQNWRDVEIVRLSRNRGVTAAWNRGAAVATGRYLMFLNNDVIATGEWVDQLCEPLRHGPLLTGLGTTNKPTTGSLPACSHSSEDDRA